VTGTGATITWTTDEPADSQVEYGTTTAYGSSTTLDPNKVASHSVPLGGLTAGTTYHYRVKSKDAAGNLATSPDATFSTGSGGASQGSLSLNGTTAYAEAPHHADLNTTGDWTVEAWFKDETAGGYNHDTRYILITGDTNSDGEAPYLIGIEWGTLFAGERTGWTNHVVSHSLGGVSANAWHHVAVTMQGSTRQLTIYLDGVQVKQATLSAQSAAGNTRAVSLGRNGTTGHYWRGKLDDVRIWNVVRTASQISAAFEVELTSAPAGLVGGWKLNEGSGTLAADSAGTAQNATLKGNAGWSLDIHP
jgi:hypothetical protein